jgi:UDP-N-acetylglucosamine 1-carboxyvinyltransferase
MAKFQIVGGKPLGGELSVVGSKNAALPLLAATLLTKDTCQITNLPDIIDVTGFLEMIKSLGAGVKREGDRVEIDGSGVEARKLDLKFFTKLRASILLLGPLLGRFNYAKLGYPGGCVIGQRPIDTHLQAIRDLGGEIKEEPEYFEAKLKKATDRTIYLREASVTATENLLMAAAHQPLTTIIEFAACEPHVENLCQMLVKMGAEITGIGSNRLKIKGKSRLRGVKMEVIPDEIEAGTFIALAAASQAPLTIKGIRMNHLKPILNQIDRMEVNYQLEKDKILLKPPFQLKPVNVQTQPWPGFPTDLQPPFTVLATQVKGTTLIHESMYDQRLYYIDELIKMNANIIHCDPHRAVVNGPAKLQAGRFFSPDIRAGIALVLAALIAQGTSEIDNINLIDRGYQKLEDRLKKVGAEIKRVD